ncbi:DUF6093 family protein [Herbiconiux solani]|uniref:DUF6093 family protein n=1 Tax=Herbiconiux solani TaxID=661329 RepID=UPI00082636AB|nr:DUF6093 family protein [Herbiconiux solani]
MVTASQAAQARRKAESQMTDTCKVLRGGTKQWNDDTLQNDVAGGQTIYEGPFKSKGVNAIQRDFDSASQLIISQDSTASFPVSAASAAIRPGDVLEWVTSLHDPSLVGRKVRVAGLAGAQSFAASRRYRVEEYS